MKVANAYTSKVMGACPYNEYNLRLVECSLGLFQTLRVSIDNATNMTDKCGHNYSPVALFLLRVSGIPDTQISIYSL